MKIVCVDTETTLITPGEFSPDLVCMSTAEPGQAPQLYDAKDSRAVWEHLIRKYDRLIFANAPFDLFVLSKAFPWTLTDIDAALCEGRVQDILLRQKLIDIADGNYRGRFDDVEDRWIVYGYSVEGLAERHLNRKLDKNTWRLRYGELRDIPIDQWPEGAKQYSLDDADVQLQIWQIQEKTPPPNEQQWARVFFDLALYAQSREGMRTDPQAVRDLTEKTERRIKELEPEFLESGLLHIKNHKVVGQIDLFTNRVVPPKYARDQKAIQSRVVEKSGDSVRRTEKGQISTDSISLRSTGDRTLENLSEYLQLLSIKNKDLKFLGKPVIHTRYDSIVSTGRASSSSPNMQNASKRPGVRECFVPRDGYVYLDVDYSMAELHTFAQTRVQLFGKCKLADVLNARRDPHIEMSARLAGVTYDDLAARVKAGDKDAKALRSIGKGPNFGLPGGMGGPKLAEYCLQSGLDLTDLGNEMLAKVTLRDLESSIRRYKYLASKKQGRGKKASIKAPPPVTMSLAEQVLYWGDYTPAQFAGVKLKELWMQVWEPYDFFTWVQDHMPYVSLPYSGRVRYTQRFPEACNYLFQGCAADAAALAVIAMWRACYVQADHALYGCRPVLFVHDQILVEAPADGAEKKLAAMKSVMETEFNKVTKDVPVRAEGQILKHWTK